MLYPTELRARKYLRYTNLLNRDPGTLTGHFHAAVALNEPLDSRMKVLRREVAVPLHHRQSAPATQRLNST